MRRSGVIALSSACALAVSAPAPGSGPTVAVAETIDRTAVNVGALRGVVVWEGRRNGRATLMRRIGGRTSRVPGVRQGRRGDDPFGGPQFSDLDVGLDHRGRVGATYRFCRAEFCQAPRIVDIRSGAQRRVRVDAPPRCKSRGQIAIWRTLLATTLMCPGRARSGVYLIRNGRARLVRRVRATREVYGMSVDLAAGVLAIGTDEGVWVGSTGSRACRRLAVRSDANLVEAKATPGHVWWGFSTAAAFGGSEYEFGSAEIGQDCAMGDTTKFESFPELDWYTGSFAVDGSTVYVAGTETGGLVSAPIR